jgi:hypothetical protein
MFSKIRRRMTYTNLVLTLVLVFAMTGGAYAAKKYLITSTKQISPTVLKQLQGKAGPAGTPGPQGPAGPVGSAGSAGTAGAKGEKGNQGEGGPRGGSGSTGPKGSVGTTGPAGATGPEGVCGTSNCTLPSGASEKGQWVVGGPPNSAARSFVVSSISFTIPLKEAPTTTQVIEIGETVPAGCNGSSGAPEAEPGNLCIFVDSSTNALGVASTPGADSAIGAVVEALPSGTEDVFVKGTWAVTEK